MLRPLNTPPEPVSASHPVIIIVVSLGRGRFDAFVEDGPFLIHATIAPFVAGCRRLIELGYDPDQQAIMRHAGSSVDSLRAAIGAAARLTVNEPDNGCIHFARWKPFPSSPVELPIAPAATARVRHRETSAIARTGTRA